MKFPKTFKIIIAMIFWSTTLLFNQLVFGQGVIGRTLDYAAQPGDNYDKAEFRLWFTDSVNKLQGVVVQVPGSNGDGRNMVADSVWQAFAQQHNLALVGCYYTDKPHEQGFIEEYADVSKGSGQTLLDALTAFASNSGHEELANAPLLLWGMSAGGEYNYEFTAWKPERVIAFVVNKGGIYYSALVSPAARQVPGILFIGGKDIEFRNNTINGLFAVNRRCGALWALAVEPNAEHIVGRSQELAMIFFADVLALRLFANSQSEESDSLLTLSEKSGYLGDLKSGAITIIGDSNIPNHPTAWLPTERVAKAWQALVTEQPWGSIKHSNLR